jgi:hypothetical protein
LAEAYHAQRGPENPLSTLELSKTAEKPPNHDYKHYMFQSSKQKETRKLQNQTLKARETPIKGENRKRGDLREISPLRGGFKSHPLHHVRNVKFAQISLVSSVKQQKIDFKLWATLDFSSAFKTVNLGPNKTKGIKR